MTVYQVVVLCLLLVGLVLLLYVLQYVMNVYQLLNDEYRQSDRQSEEV